MATTLDQGLPQPAPTATTPTGSDILQKYAAERTKRFQARQQTDGKRSLDPSSSDSFQHLLSDPWADHAALNAQDPPALADGQRTDVLVLGAGHGGLMLAAALVDEAGFKPESIRFVDSAGGFGGTWWWNRYPGLMCDTESAVYMPLLEQTGYVPKHRYAYGPELLEHAQRVAQRWGLADKALFRSVVDSLEWDDEAREWVVRITEYRGPQRGFRALAVRARFVFLSSGLLSHPQIPKAPGFEAFQPPCFHTARWDYACTGGAPEDPRMERLRDKRVGIIGTGATGVQVVPELAKWAKELYVFQRTPASVDVRGQRPITREEWEREVAAEAGWQMKRMENFASYVLNTPVSATDLVDDGWTHAAVLGLQVGSEAWGTITRENAEGHVAAMQALDLPRMQRIRQRVDDVVKDGATAEKLRPWYSSWCNRPCFHDDYLPAFNAPNVRLVDTDGRGIDGFTETAVVANGEEFPVDVLVLATGFVSPFAGDGSPAQRARVRIVGRGGRDMADKWREGVATLHGLCTNGFPNLFFPGVAQAGLVPNISHLFRIVAQHIAYTLAEARERAGADGWDGVVVEPTREAEERWALRNVEAAAFFAPVATCAPGTINDDGAKAVPPSSPEEALKKARNVVWPRGILSYADILKKWREDGKMDGLEVSA